MMYGGGMMSGFGVIGLLFNVAVVVGIVLLVVWAVKRFSGSAGVANQPGGGQSPKEILQARYARGEITREQYQQMLQDLT